MIKKMIKKNEKKTRKIAIFQKMKNCNFPRVFFIFSFFYHCFIIFHHFCFQWCNNFPRNGKLQFSSSSFHFFIIFLSFLLPVVELMKNDKKWWKMIKKMIKKNEKKLEENCNFPKNEKLQFSSSFFHFFHFFFIFLSFFYHFFYPFCFQWWNWWKMIKTDEKWKKNEKKW